MRSRWGARLAAGGEPQAADARGLASRGRTVTRRRKRRGEGATDRLCADDDGRGLAGALELLAGLDKAAARACGALLLLLLLLSLLRALWRLLVALRLVELLLRGEGARRRGLMGCTPRPARRRARRRRRRRAVLGVLAVALLSRGAGVAPRAVELEAQGARARSRASAEGGGVNMGGGKRGRGEGQREGRGCGDARETS